MKTKTLILTILLGCAVSVSSNAQDIQKKDCSCKKKTAHHKVIKKAASNPVAVNNKKPYIPACYNKPGLVVKDCPVSYNNNSGCIYDSVGNIAYVIENNYLGFYPNSIDITETAPTYKSLSVSSTAFKNYGPLPSKYSCEGTKVSPPLTVGNIPDNTQSLAIIMIDPSATPNGDERTYWVAWDIDTTASIPENFVNDHMALNSAMQYGYQAVCPIGGSHYYHFKVYALDTKLVANKHASRIDIENAMKGHILAKGDLVGVYNRTTY